MLPARSLDVMGQSKERLGVCARTRIESAYLFFEIVQLNHQPSCGIAFLHGATQVGKIVNDENLAVGLHSHLFNAAYDSFLKVGIQKLVAVNRHPIEFVGKGVELSMLVGIAELELLFGQFKVQIQHIVGSGGCGRLSARQGWTCPRWNRQTSQESSPSYQKLSHSARGVGNNDASRMVWFAVLIFIMPTLSGIPLCAWDAFVRSPRI